MRAELEPGDVHLWRVRLDQPQDELRRLGELLDEGESRRAAAFAFERDRSRFVVAHGALREILARYTGGSPRALRFVAGMNGKPALAGHGPEFNLSHSEAVALVAISAGEPVGVDVERIRGDRSIEAIAQRFFGPEETASLLASPDPLRTERFFRLWTCKESCVKADGSGVAAIETVPIAFDGSGAAGSATWAIEELRPAPGYVGALAARTGPLRVLPHAWIGARGVSLPSRRTSRYSSRLLSIHGARGRGA